MSDVMVATSIFPRESVDPVKTANNKKKNYQLCKKSKT